MQNRLYFGHNIKLRGTSNILAIFTHKIEFFVMTLPVNANLHKLRLLISNEFYQKITSLIELRKIYGSVVHLIDKANYGLNRYHLKHIKLFQVI